MGAILRSACRQTPRIQRQEERALRIDEKGEIENQTYKFYEWMTRNPLDAKECRECVYLPACGGGCGAISYNETNSYTGKGCFKIKGCIEKQVINYVSEILKKDIK